MTTNSNDTRRSIMTARILATDRRHFPRCFHARLRELAQYDSRRNGTTYEVELEKIKRMYETD